MSDDNVLYCLETLSQFEPDDIEHDEFDIAVNDDQFASMSIVRTAELAAELITKQAAELSKYRADGWISVDSDNEPLNYQVVLISTTDADGDQVTVTATYNGDGKYLVTGGYRDKDLTHWMPLPKPPES